MPQRAAIYFIPTITQNGILRSRRYPTQVWKLLIRYIGDGLRIVHHEPPRTTTKVHKVADLRSATTDDEVVQVIRMAQAPFHQGVWTADLIPHSFSIWAKSRCEMFGGDFAWGRDCALVLHDAPGKHNSGGKKTDVSQHHLRALEISQVLVGFFRESTTISESSGKFEFQILIHHAFSSVPARRPSLMRSSGIAS